MPAQNRAERRALNQRAFFEARQAARAERGPRGLAESWVERAYKVAADREKLGDPEAWNDLSRTISTWCSRYEQ
ncbi:hypothetical protein [Streptomyces sp. NPDC059783]|uniref:hypothetical protein n=1 Tax=Streptomyces sp. NPDC059783 TaxID=3346944 RepID=UPI0036541436